MCGLVGAAGSITVTHEKAVSDLLVMDSLRGTHSTGVLSVNTKNEYTIVKEALNPWEFIDAGLMKEAMKGANKVLIGHNRYATQGEINSQNAHPFLKGMIGGAHNGTLRNQSLLPDHKDFVVDSENIIHAINEIGIDETCKKLHGAYALTWWDFTNEQLNFLRNSERPLFYVFTDDNRTMFWASEKYMLLAALHRRKIKHKEVQEVPIHTLHTFNIPLTYATNRGIIDKPRVRKLEHYVAPKVESQWQNWRGGQSANRSAGGSSGVGIYASSFLKSLGYNGKKRIPFIVTHHDPRYGEAVGVTCDGNSVEVRFYCSDTKFRAFELHCDTRTGMLYTTSINSYREPGQSGDNGMIRVGQYNIEEGSLNLPPREDEKEEAKIEDHRGNDITESEFNRRYSTCGWCDHPLEFTDEKMTLMTHNEGVCGACSASMDVFNSITA